MMVPRLGRTWIDQLQKRRIHRACCGFRMVVSPCRTAGVPLRSEFGRGSAATKARLGVARSFCAMMAAVGTSAIRAACSVPMERLSRCTTSTTPPITSAKLPQQFGTQVRKSSQPTCLSVSIKTMVSTACRSSGATVTRTPVAVCSTLASRPVSERAATTLAGKGVRSIASCTQSTT